MNDFFPQSQETFAEHSANENILRSWGTFAEHSANENILRSWGSIDNDNAQEPDANSNDNNVGNDMLDDLISQNVESLEIEVNFERDTSNIIGGEESLNNLVNALNKNPQVNIQISGNANFSYDKGFNGETPTMVNGEKRKISDLQIERAKAVKEFLIKRNISPNRLDINTGRIGPNSRSASIKIVK